MNRFIIGAIVGGLLGAIGAWYAISSDKEKRIALKYAKSLMSSVDKM